MTRPRNGVSIGLIGPGRVGSALLDQMAEQVGALRASEGIALTVQGIMSRSVHSSVCHEIDLARWRDCLRPYDGVGAGALADTTRFVSLMSTKQTGSAVAVDCTADAEVAASYPDWLRKGIHVVTPNKKSLSGPMQTYDRLMTATRQSGVRFLYETTVGAGLPIIQTLRHLRQTGDRIHHIQGVLSGTVAYLLNAYNGSSPFSDVVLEAASKGLTEPDPLEDLSGVDMARKLVILAREIGLELELSDVDIEGIGCVHAQRDSNQLLQDQLKEADSWMAARLSKANRSGEVLRYVGSIDPRTGSCDISLRQLARNHPLARGQGADNVLVIHTSRYTTNPIIIQGPGAGPDVTAGGVFADILRIVMG